MPCGTRNLAARGLSSAEECDWTTTSIPSLAFFLRSFTLLQPRACTRSICGSPRAFVQSPSRRRSEACAFSRIIARLNPGITPQQAQAQLEVLSDSLRREYGSDYPATAGWTLSVTPLTEVVAGSTRTLLTSLLLAVGLILLIACVNVANLLLVNATARQREMALRLALGATRGRIIRQMLTESVLLSLTSAAAGVGAAAIGLRVLVGVLPSQLPRLNPIGLDARVLAFSRHRAADYLCLWADPGMAGFANASGHGGTAGTGRLCIAALRPTRQIFDWR